MSRSTSPIKLPGPGKYAIDVVGVSKYQDTLLAICGGRRTEDGAQQGVEALLECEDGNPHDDQAVRVEIRGKTVGYLDRQHARQYRQQLELCGQARAILVCAARIVGGWDRGNGNWGYFGVRLDLPVGQTP